MSKRIYHLSCYICFMLILMECYSCNRMCVLITLFLFNVHIMLYFIVCVLSPMSRPRGFWHLTFSSVNIPSLIFTFVSESPLSPYPRGGTLFILNVRTAPGLDTIVIIPWVECQNPLGCSWEKVGLGIHDEWCMNKILYNRLSNHLGTV